jgi:ABC-type dipeptide/oligopeptide/nickel transport system permease component
MKAHASRLIAARLGLALLTLLIVSAVVFGIAGLLPDGASTATAISQKEAGTWRLSREALANVARAVNFRRRCGRQITANTSYGDAAFVLSADFGL